MPVPDSGAFANSRARYKDSDSDAFAQPWCSVQFLGARLGNALNRKHGTMQLPRLFAKIMPCFSAVLCAAMVMAGSLCCEYTTEFLVSK